MSDNQLKSIMQRIIALHEAEDEIKADRRDIYAEAKSAGYDKTALGVAIREIRGRDKAETPEAQERAAIVENYLAEYDRPHVRAHMHEAPEPSPSRIRTGTVAQEENHVDRGASARPHDPVGNCINPIASKPGDCGTGQGVCELPPSGAETGRDVRPVPPSIAKPIDLTIPAFLDRRIPKPEARQ